jgi:CheY-like chemotaxis protein
MEQTKDNRLEQVVFLHTLAKDFDRFYEMYLKAWQTLRKYEKIPVEMTEEEWSRVVGALSDYYKSVRFFYKIALLTESGIIDVDLLYIFYHQEIIDHLTWMISSLIKWCSTGLELAANYGPDDLAYIAGTSIKLLEKLTAVHKEKGFDISFDEGVIESFKERNRDFFANPEKFDAQESLDKYVTIEDKSGKEPRVKILVVDDEEQYLEFVSNLLITEGYEVDTAVDGIDALAKIKGNRYSILLTGIRMPYMSGFEFYDHVQKIDPSLANKTIVISGSVYDEDTKEFLAENKLTYMAKPFDCEQLKKVVNSLFTHQSDRA